MKGKVINPARKCRICGAECEKTVRYCRDCAREVEEMRERREGNIFQTAPSGGAPEARKSRSQEDKLTPANS